MKTSNKTNRRFLGIVVAITVLSLVTTNLDAQKSYNNTSFADLSDNYFFTTKCGVCQDISQLNTDYTIMDEQPIADWMINSSEFGLESGLAEVDSKETENAAEYRNMETYSEKTNLKEDVFQLEGWMIESNWHTNHSLESELLVDEWGSNSNSLTCSR